MTAATVTPGHNQFTLPASRSAYNNSVRDQLRTLCLPSSDGQLTHPGTLANVWDRYDAEMHAMIRAEAWREAAAAWAVCIADAAVAGEQSNAVEEYVACRGRYRHWRARAETLRGQRVAS